MKTEIIGWTNAGGELTPTCYNCGTSFQESFDKYDKDTQTMVLEGYSVTCSGCESRCAWPKFKLEGE